MSASTSSWCVQHPVIARLVLIGLAFFTVTGLIEIVLRIAIPYNPGYYVAVDGDAHELVYPFGRIHINSHGFADEEFNLSNPLRVGYFGDSVNYGTGAGYGYRISELLAEAYPDYEHMNFGGIDLSIDENAMSKFVEIARRFGLTKAVYLLNLNDVLPDQAVRGEQKSKLFAMRRWMQRNLDWMRGQSYLYTYARTLIKTYLARQGTGWLGYPAYELHPVENEGVLIETAERINRFGGMLAQDGIGLIVVVLPYEMQISNEAAETYAQVGVEWGEGFIEGLPQRVIVGHLEAGIAAYDAYESFVDLAAPEASRERNRVGQYFVFNKGDKIDWNHPNREGHRVIAEYLIRRGIFGVTVIPVGSTYWSSIDRIDFALSSMVQSDK